VNRFAHAADSGGRHHPDHVHNKQIRTFRRGGGSQITTAAFAATRPISGTARIAALYT
jgi:hypothetical protein